MNQVLATLIIGCSIFDAAFTCWRVSEHGTRVERSLLTRKSIEAFGSKAGTFLSIILPNFIIATVACLLGWGDLLLFYGGYRLSLAMMQLASMKGKHG